MAIAFTNLLVGMAVSDVGALRGFSEISSRADKWEYSTKLILPMFMMPYPPHKHYVYEKDKRSWYEEAYMIAKANKAAKKRKFEADVDITTVNEKLGNFKVPLEEKLDDNQKSLEDRVSRQEKKLDEQSKKLDEIITLLNVLQK
jgi:hypothetical protein